MLYKLPPFLYQSEQPESAVSLFHALRTLQPVEVFHSLYIVQLMHYRKSVEVLEGIKDEGKKQRHRLKGARVSLDRV